ncbi:hypothetical protein AAKU67_001207 [Oxalobacteraceae bacterium GrIS 2.11]
MSSTLHGQQQQFADALQNDASCSLFKPTPQGTAPRLFVYSDAYRIRLGEALKENYPVLARVLGDDGFADLANAFLRDNPSRTASIRWFGTALANYVERTDDVLPHPALGDLIRMEWALNTAFDAADATPLTVADMLTLAPEAWPDLQFLPHPSLRLLALEWNVEPLWTAVTADENAEAEPPEPLQHHLLIWRVEYRTLWRSVEAIEAQLLNATLAGHSFAELCETAAESNPDAAAETVAGYLRIWVEAGMLAGMKEK